MENEYDPRCSNCHHYPWTDRFEDLWNSRNTRSTLCPCKCHNVPRRKRLMRFSLYEGMTEDRDDYGRHIDIPLTSQHVMYVEKLAFCPFCKRSEFDDSVYSLINRGSGAYLESFNSIRHKMNKGYSKDSDGLHYDTNEFIIKTRNNHSKLVSSCCGNHKHDWNECKCGRVICKVSFRECFGYEFSDDLFENDYVDKSHYSEEAKELQAEDKYEQEYRREPKEAVVPTFATMETIEKVWGKLPRERSHMMLETARWGKADGVSKYFSDLNSLSEFLYSYQDQITLPAAFKVRKLGTEPWVPLYTPEEVTQREKEAEESRKYYAEYYQIEAIRGIGEETAEKLIKKFKTADKVFSATAEQISKIPKLSKRAKSIRTALDNHRK